MRAEGCAPAASRSEGPVEPRRALSQRRFPRERVGEGEPRESDDRYEQHTDDSAPLRACHLLHCSGL